MRTDFEEKEWDVRNIKVNSDGMGRNPLERWREMQAGVDRTGRGRGLDTCQE
jgi:hypothetical protein